MNVLAKETPESSFAPLPHDYSEKTVSHLGRKQTLTRLCPNLDLELPRLWNCKKSFLSFISHPVYGFSFRSLNGLR
jgi:hypothetical protein